MVYNFVLYNQFDKILIDININLRFIHLFFLHLLNKYRYVIKIDGETR